MKAILYFKQFTIVVNKKSYQFMYIDTLPNSATNTFVLIFKKKTSYAFISNIWTKTKKFKIKVSYTLFKISIFILKAEEKRNWSRREMLFFFAGRVKNNRRRPPTSFDNNSAYRKVLFQSRLNQTHNGMDVINHVFV